MSRTLLDLAEILDRRRLARATDRAEVLGVFDGFALQEVLARAAGRHGVSVLRSILRELDSGLTITESELEERFLALCVNAAIDLPLVNQWIMLPGEPVKVDFLWPDQRLIVETDGRHVHGSRQAFERDRRRERLVLAGYRVVRCTWKQVVDDPELLARTLNELLTGP